MNTHETIMQYPLDLWTADLNSTASRANFERLKFKGHKISTWNRNSDYLNGHKFSATPIEAEGNQAQWGQGIRNTSS